MNVLLQETTSHLAAFLNRVLPTLGDGWWQERVMWKLSLAQQRSAGERGHTQLKHLDLAALLRVFGGNWGEIRDLYALPYEGLNYVKEMGSVRNRWAHMGSEGPPVHDLYRDLDTLYRFLKMIDAPAELRERVGVKRDGLFIQKTVPVAPVAAPVPVPVAAGTSAPATEFGPGTIVRFKSDPKKEGVVTGVTPGQPENRYQVFVDGQVATFFGSQLLGKEESAPQAQTLDLKAFHGYLSALQLRHPSLAKLYSLRAARIDPIPYQYRPVLKFINADRPRLLIADDVGVGKTIEAGLILRELQARKSLDRVLIICPKPLVAERKWQSELKRFDEDFEHLDGPALRRCLDEADQDGVWPERYARAIVPTSLLNADTLGGTRGRRKGGKGLLDLDPPPHFDLVIVDEAHHLRNAGTRIHENVRFLCDHAEAVIFLSATPIQLGSQDLFTLLNMLRPDLVVDAASFKRMAEPNPFINRAVELARQAQEGWLTGVREQLEQAANTSWGRALLVGHPDFEALYAQTGAAAIDDPARVAMIRGLEQLHTFSAMINRTRRRDIGAFTTRKPETVAIAFTPEQQKLHDALLDAQRSTYERRHGTSNVHFMMTTLRRQAASCLYGLAPLIRDLLGRQLAAVEAVSYENGGDEVEIADAELTALRDELREVLSLAEHLSPHDPKLEALLKLIEDKQALPNNKALVFSSFRHTLRYLLQHLQTAGVRVGLIHGDVPDEERRALRNRFSLPKDDPEAIDVLLNSEVGCEGLDYQFCDCLVNYDLPWNPMRVEQRIGRIDRYGQKSDTVAIYNFITPGTVDADIYDRCLDRIGVFRSALGGNEEILGRLTEQLREVAENLKLTDEERRERLQQLADNEVRHLQEEEQLEERDQQLFAQRLAEGDGEEEMERASSFWLSPASLQNLVQQYLERLCGPGEYLLGERTLKTLRLSQEARNKLLEDYRHRLKPQASPVFREWEKYLKGSNQHFSLTFDGPTANEKRDVALVTPIHPLAQQAARAIASTEVPRTAFKVVTEAVAPGEYPFAIFKWQKRGIREDVIFQPVCGEAALTEHFFALLETAEALPEGAVAFPSQAVYDGLWDAHHPIFTDARSDHQEYVAQMAACRRESLTTSHLAHMKLLEDQLAAATEERIQRMRKSQIESAQADHARRLAAIDQGAEQADIHADAVVYGVVVVTHGK